MKTWISVSETICGSNRPQEIRYDRGGNPVASRQALLLEY